MRQDQVEVGQHYFALVGGSLSVVRIDAEAGHGYFSLLRTWRATVVASGRRLRLGASRLRARAVQKEGQWVGLSHRAQ